MPWTTTQYPVSMKNLDSDVRDKAVSIANALLNEGYDEGRAIPIAIATAKKWGENHDPDDYAIHQLHVVPHPQGWAVRRVNAERASFVFSNRDDAQQKATEMAVDEDGSVVIHNDSGQIEAHVVPTESNFG
jgi:uncharacterized protein YdaT